MKVLVTGSGQLAWELEQTVPASVELVKAPRAVLDITDDMACERVLSEVRPDWVINAAAYTAVDKAETEVEQAYAVNETGAANLARASARCGARLMHVSTDFVFDGNTSRPYEPGSDVNPQSVYGASKLAGERAVLKELSSAVIVRTAWVYSAHGQNFVKTMLRLMREKPELGVIVDQVGTPTWARGLAEVLWQGVSRAVPGGVYHWSDAGVASWYDFAVAIQDAALKRDRLHQAIPVKPIRTEAFPTPAKRPAYSVLDKASTWEAIGVAPVHWRHQLEAMMDTLAD
ncbi:dTDP-4-dehydrorhamnose reductase [Saccharospirillum salsuginis]|uniref:dTDP-4-dehydrorhamnose reductase n=1 Tax=Saccharospirillum salsuginis TaxID=418750 RepID=A0A918KEH7_9GAMM|nr:dTDP-4-dehydrorhamnose reductase [Saccharospirillum salsuginis]GGX60238.1 NAD(P)-dependent oxidoreductase [Saccharospirillum salsuginis]